MFGLFKRAAPPVPPRKPKAPAAAKRRRGASDFAELAALPEVVEGNEGKDWALWEDSVSIFDSQFASDETRPAGLDPFHRVSKNRDS